MKIHTCKCGQPSKPWSPSSIGDISKQSGFQYVASHSGNMNWLCNDCFDKAQIAAKTIDAIVGDRDLYFAGLLRERNK